GRVVLIDTGPDPQLLAACLEQLEVRQVEALVLSHFHADHVGGVAAVLDQYPVAAAYVTPVRDPPAEADLVLGQLAEAQIPTYAVTSGDHLVWGADGQVRATVVWPPAADAGGLALGANDASVVLDLTVAPGGADAQHEPAEAIRMLFTGDIEP